MMAAETKSGPMLTVRQIRSGIGFDKTQKATLRAMGLGRVGCRRQHPDNRAIRGMIFKIRHLVVVEEPDSN